MKTFGILATLLLLAPIALAGSYFVVFEYDVGSETLVQKEVEFLWSDAPDAYFDGNVGISLIGPGGEAYSTTVSVPLFTSKSYTAENEPAVRTMEIMDRVEFEAVLPYYENARGVEVFDSNGTKMLSFELPEAPSTPAPGPGPEPEPEPCCSGFIILFGLAGCGWLYAKCS